jgi:thiamine biosynthesis lipoprotein
MSEQTPWMPQTDILSRRTLLRRAGTGALATVGGGLSLFPSRDADGKPLTEYRQARYMMGTVVEIAVATADKQIADRAMAYGFQALQQVDQCMSIYQPTSELSRINRRAAHTWVHTDPDILTVTAEALHMSRLSDGAIDITILPLMRLWGFVQQAGRVPTAAELQATLPLVSYRHVHLDRSRGAVHFARTGVELDLGGIAKGFAVDQAVAALVAHGANHALVNAGGDLFALGTATPENSWVVDIQHPHRADRSLATIRVHNRSVATSGNYEKYFEQHGKRYCHLIDPRTGYPVEAVASVTVLADTAMQADAISTAAFALGPDQGFALIERLPNVEGIMAVERHEASEALFIRISSGLKDAVTFS